VSETLLRRSYHSRNHGATMMHVSVLLSGLPVCQMSSLSPYVYGAGMLRGVHPNAPHSKHSPSRQCLFEMQTMHAVLTWQNCATRQ
jgi:hypothetical protein